MSLKSLDIINFRSYGRQHFDFAPQLNLIIGPNGAGKTNLLEAIYVLANTKSWRQQDRHLVKNNQQEYKLTGVLKNKDIGVLGQIGEAATKKQVFINQTKAKPRDYLGSLKTVLFEPESLGIVYGSPENRRRWLNQVLSADPGYLAHLLRYRRVLRQRNALLKNPQARDIKEQIFAWDLSLAETATIITEHRLKFIDFLDRKITAAYKSLTGQSIRINFQYQILPEALAKSQNYASKLIELLDSNFLRDQRAKFTTIGPHRDEVTIIFKDRPIGRVASRGEARTLVLAIKLLEHQWLSSDETTPILLFDDIFSELDLARRKRALAQLKGSQVFITAVDESGLIIRYGRQHQQIRLKP